MPDLRVVQLNFPPPNVNAIVRLNGVNFREAARDPKSPHGRFTIQRGRQTRTYYTPDGGDEAMSYAARQALLGWSRKQTDVSVSGKTRVWIQRFIPDTYPVFFDAQIPDAGNYLWCQEVSNIEPVGTPIGVDLNGLGKYLQLKITAEYDTVPWLVKADIEVVPTRGQGPLAGIDGSIPRPDEGVALASGWLNSRYIVRHLRGNTTTYTLPGGFLNRIATADGISAGKINYGIPYHQMEMPVAYTWMMVPTSCIPANAIANCANSVNDSLFDIFPIGTLLFNHFAFNDYNDIYGRPLTDVTYYFIFKPNQDPVTSTYNGHNSWPAVDSNKKFRFARYSTDGLVQGPQNTPQPLKDLTALFRPDQP